MMRIIDLVSPAEMEASLRDHLVHRRLPDVFLYDGPDGAGEWLGLDGSGTFDVASDLTELLGARAAAVASRVPDGATLVSLGVGGGEKERLLLTALAGRGVRRYVAVDASRALVERALEAVADVPVEAVGVAARIEDLARIRTRVRPPMLLCLLGNTFSNFEPGPLLGLAAAQLTPADRFLFDCRLRPASAGAGEGWRRDVERTYGSRQNARFNLGPLTARGVSPDACRFSLRLARVPTPSGAAWRTVKEIHVLRDASVSFPAGPVQLRAGEVIEMGFTYKHSQPQVLRHLRQAGFEAVESFEDARRGDLLVLARKEGDDDGQSG